MILSSHNLKLINFFKKKKLFLDLNFFDFHNLNLFLKYYMGMNLFIILVINKASLQGGEKQVHECSH